MLSFYPEGYGWPAPPTEIIQSDQIANRIFQARCIKCDEFHNLHVVVGKFRGIIPREEAALGTSDGSVKEYSILSRVGKYVCFCMKGINSDGSLLLSRKAAQEQALTNLLSEAKAGDIIPAVVQNVTDYGVFCDIGCGITALMRIDRCCISRINTPAVHFHAGQQIYTAILEIDTKKQLFHLTGRELLGTWEENAAKFKQEETVTGFVRSIMPYGLFIELTPNLSGLCEPDPRVKEGDFVSVYIRAIQQDRHKIKLNILDVLPQPLPQSLFYFKKQGHIDHWEYYPGSKATTVF